MLSDFTGFCAMWMLYNMSHIIEDIQYGISWMLYTPTYPGIIQYDMPSMVFTRAYTWVYIVWHTIDGICFETLDVIQSDIPRKWYRSDTDLYPQNETKLTEQQIWLAKWLQSVLYFVLQHATYQLAKNIEMFH